MAGIFFSDANDNWFFNFMRPYPIVHLPEANFNPIPAPFTICSSASGLVLCRDQQTHSYHIINPFAQASYRLIPEPPRSHQSDPPAVLAVELHNGRTSPVFNIICAVLEYPGYYTFDIFSSHSEGWIKAEDYVNLQPGLRINPNTGVSNDWGMAFWLTEVPHTVIKFAVDNDNGNHYSELIDIPPGLNPWARLQLGRFSDVEVGLVAASMTDVQLFILQIDPADPDDYVWDPRGFLNVRRENSAAATDDALEVVCRQPQEKPEVLRFEKDVPLWINGRITLWELNGNERLLEMPEWVNVPRSVRDSVPYVYTHLVPSQFGAR